MGVVEAVALLLQLTNLIGSVAANAQSIGAMISKLQAEGRAKFTDDEWAQIKALDDAARGNLEAAIKQAGVV